MEKFQKMRGMQRLTAPTAECPNCGHVTTEVDRVFNAFNGPRNLATALAEVGHTRNLATLYKWSYPRPRGSNGRIPDDSRTAVYAAAANRGIAL